MRMVRRSSQDCHPIPTGRGQASRATTRVRSGWGGRPGEDTRACIARRGETLPFSLNLCQLRERHDGRLLFSWTYTLRACSFRSGKEDGNYSYNAKEGKQE